MAVLDDAEAQREKVLELLRRWGRNTTGFQVLERGFRYLFLDDDACVAYVDTGRAWVVAGAPIAAPERLAEVTRRVIDAATQAGRRVCFFAVEQRFREATQAPCVLIGEQPTWDPRRWSSESLAGRRSLREQLRRARAKQVTVRLVPASEMADPSSPTRCAALALVERWLATRAMPAMGFLVDVQLFDFPDERRYFVAEQEGRLVGFLCAVPIFGREGWFFEDLLRHPEAPNGTTELLVDEGMRQLADQGSSFVTLGLAPLAGPVASWLGRIRRLGAALYDFDGVRSFKAKLGPHGWEGIWLAHPPGTSANLALVDALAAFARGSFFGFGLRAFLRGPAIVVRALALLLVPWTILVATADPAWFPSPAVQIGWTVFDVVLAAGLFGLSLRWHRGLALTLTGLVGADAIVTAVEAAWWNVPRLASVADGWVLVTACAGPILGALALAGALRRSGW